MLSLPPSPVLILWTISDLLIGGVPAPSPADRYTTAAQCPNGQYGVLPSPTRLHGLLFINTFVLLLLVFFLVLASVPTFSFTSGWNWLYGERGK